MTKTHRRTVSIADELHKMIMKYMGIITADGYDVDYTRVVNMLIVLGFRLLFKETKGGKMISKETLKIMKKYLGNSLLKLEALDDEVDNMFRSAIEACPELIDQLLNEEVFT